MADWIDIGKVQTLPRGEYASTTQYEKNDVVEYQHYSFICRKSCVGTPPVLNTTTEYWQQIAEAPESTLSALTDVNISSVVDKQALVYDASTQKWINGESGTKIEKLDDIGDVTVSATPSNKDVLSYDSASGKWKNDASISDDLANKADKATTLAGYGITDAVSSSDLDGKQDKTDNTLATTSKTVVGAINEVNSALANKANCDKLLDVNTSINIKSAVTDTLSTTVTSTWLQNNGYKVVFISMILSNGSVYFNTMRCYPFFGSTWVTSYQDNVLLTLNTSGVKLQSTTNASANNLTITNFKMYGIK